MNIERILEVAHKLERSATPIAHFDMAIYFNRDTTRPAPAFTTDQAMDLKDYLDELLTPELRECNTAGCLAGHVAALYPDYIRSRTLIREAAARALDVNVSIAENLFTPQILYPSISKLRATRVLRHLAASGRVDWTLPVRKLIETGSGREVFPGDLLSYEGEVYEVRSWTHEGPERVIIRSTRANHRGSFAVLPREINTEMLEEPPPIQMGPGIEYMRCEHYLYSATWNEDHQTLRLVNMETGKEIAGELSSLADAWKMADADDAERWGDRG